MCKLVTGWVVEVVVDEKIGIFVLFVSAIETPTNAVFYLLFFKLTCCCYSTTAARHRRRRSRKFGRSVYPRDSESLKQGVHNSVIHVFYYHFLMLSDVYLLPAHCTSSASVVSFGKAFLFTFFWW